MDIKLEINEQEVTVPNGSTIMQAAQKLDIYIPHFCYHEKLSIAANCRMCMVDIEKSPKALPACATPAVDGMVVRTTSDKAKQAQHGVMEFLLINHPLDCPICDQGGECQLQDLAVGYGVSRSRYREEKRVVFEKNLGPLISTDMTRCIHCTRCVRFGREVAGIMELGMTGRGEHAEIMPFVERTVDSEISGNMIDICPVGALTSKPFRYSARPWELKRHDTVATHDSWGSHLTVQTKGDIVKRVVPCRAAGIHEHWISDRDRFSYEGLSAADRALAPVIRAQGGKTLKEIPWKEALQTTARQLQNICKQHGSEQVGFFISPRASMEESLLLTRIARHLGCKNIDSRLQQRHFDGDDISGFGIPLSDLKTIRNILFIGAEPARELPLLAAYLRQNTKKKSVFSIAAQNLSGQLPLKQQIITSPDKFKHYLTQILKKLGGTITPDNEEAQSDLFSPADMAEDEINKIADGLSKGNTVIWLGDVARSAANYGEITSLARQLAAHIDCPLGTLTDGGNGIGVRLTGALPADNGMNTAAMLRANLRAVVLLRCEKSDFAEAALAKQMLQQAEFTCAISSYSGEFNNCADVILPAAEFTETDGTYINGSGERNSVSAVAALPGKSRPAWKIMRMLGEYLSAEGFDFNDLAAVRGWLPEQNTTVTASLPVQTAAAGQQSNTYCLYGGMPTYGGDALVRRAASLQKTRQGKNAKIACMNPQDMQAAQLDDNSSVIISDADGNEEETVIIADAALARNVLRFYPKHLTAAGGLSIRPAAEAKTA